MDLKFVDENHVYLDGEKLHKKRGREIDFARFIYYNDKYFVKIDFSSGRQCFTEWKKWNEFYDNHKKFFTPAICFGNIETLDGEYIITERKRFKKKPNPLKHKETKEFLEVLEFYDLRWDADIGEHDGCMVNCGITTSNQIMCYDYGRLAQHY